MRDDRRRRQRGKGDMENILLLFKVPWGRRRPSPRRDLPVARGRLACDVVCLTVEICLLGKWRLRDGVGSESVLISPPVLLIQHIKPVGSSELLIVAVKVSKAEVVAS